LSNVYDGFTHKFSNENSFMRAYKTIGHTTLSYASIISMKNRPLLDRKVINESNQRKKRELKERLSRQQEQQKRRKRELVNRRNKLNIETSTPPIIIETISLHEDDIKNNEAIKEKEPIKKGIDNEIKVEVLRTLSFSEDEVLSSKSLESLKSIDYIKIEDIINEYMITPVIPVRYEVDEEHYNCLNHLYDAYNYFNNLNLKQYIAWISLNGKVVSMASILAKKHAPFVFKKTITHPKRVSSLNAKYINYKMKNDSVSDIVKNDDEIEKQKRFVKKYNQKSPQESIINKNTIDKKQELTEKQQSSPNKNRNSESNFLNNKSKSLHTKIVKEINENKNQKKKQNYKKFHKDSFRNKKIEREKMKEKSKVQSKIKNNSNNKEEEENLEFPFYHMYDAFKTYGKPLLRAPRAWRQLKKNVISIASIYSYDNRPL